MKKRFTRDILTCYDCPNYGKTFYQLDYCLVERRTLEQVARLPIPDWCPLPDVKVRKAKC